MTWILEGKERGWEGKVEGTGEREGKEGGEGRVVKRERRGDEREGRSERAGGKGEGGREGRGREGRERAGGKGGKGERTGGRAGEKRRRYLLLLFAIVFSSSEFPIAPDTQEILLDHVSCNGTEQNLLSCPRGNVSVTPDCSHAKDVVVYCGDFDASYVPPPSVYINRRNRHLGIREGASFSTLPPSSCMQSTDSHSGLSGTNLLCAECIFNTLNSI